MRVWQGFASVLLLGACTPEPPPRLLDTGWFDEATGEPDGCQDKFVSVVPEDGTAGWYWRDRPGAFTATPRTLRYDAWLADGDAQRVPTTLAWAESNLSFDLVSDGWLEPDTAYTMFLKDCEAQQEITFTTSSLGQPLVGGPSSLIGNTYLVDLAEADWVEPPTLGPLVALYVNDPILLEVTYADASDIRLLGAPGLVQGGEIRQDTSVPTWNLGLSPFLDQPFVNAQSELVNLQYKIEDEVIAIPVKDFLFQGTFSADGARIGGSVLAGRADTRFVGETIQGSNPARLCELAEAQGVPCVACDDGEELCLDLVARRVEATLLPSVDLLPTRE